MPEKPYIPYETLSTSLQGFVLAGGKSDDGNGYIIKVNKNGEVYPVGAEAIRSEGRTQALTQAIEMVEGMNPKGEDGEDAEYVSRPDLLTSLQNMRGDA